MKKTFKHAIAIALLAGFVVFALGSMGSSPSSSSSSSSSRRECSTCYGSGKQSCHYCRAEGVIWEGGQQITCPICGGSREITCRTCNGRGYI
jgi:DnaJ-class molecular chaperone